MDRRHVLRLLGALAAATGLSPRQLSALGAPGARRRPRTTFFTPLERATIEAIAEAIMPRTDTPGATDARLADYIELIVSEWYRPPDRGRFMRGVSDVDVRARTRGNRSFAAADTTDQATILSELEAEGRAQRVRDTQGPAPFFHRIRGLVLHGYYTSEVGMTEELLWQVIPGRYEGCVDVARVTRSTPEEG